MIPRFIQLQKQTLQIRAGSLFYLLELFPPLGFMLFTLCKPGFLSLPGFLQISAALLAISGLNVILSIAKRTTRLKDTIAGNAVFISPRIFRPAIRADQLPYRCPISGNNGGVASRAGKWLVGIDRPVHWSAT